MSAYDAALICENGHLANLSFYDAPEFNRTFCKQCGAQTIHSCPECDASIQGHLRGEFPELSWKPPAYCHNCGKPYPWTSRKLQAAVELFTEEVGDTDESARFSAAVEDIVRDTPRTTLGASRFKKAMARVGSETGSAIRNVLVDIVSEAAKKMIWP